METYAKGGIRGMLPETVRIWYRDLRLRLLTAGLRAQGPGSLAEDERLASANISVIIAVHDAPEVTGRCLGSVRAFGGDAEIIIVDDGSKLDVTKRLLRDACATNGWRLISHTSALGHTRASETGVSASGRPFVCLLNSDTILTPRSWLGIAKAFEASEDIAVAGPSTSHTTTSQCVRRALYCRHYWSDEQVSCFAEKYVAKHQQDLLVDLPMVGGFAFFVRRNVWNELGGFDRNLPDYGNETEFCQRVRRRRLRIVWSKASYIHHLGSESYGRTVGLAKVDERCMKADAYIQEKCGR